MFLLRNYVIYCKKIIFFFAWNKIKLELKIDSDGNEMAGNTKFINVVIMSHAL